MLIKNEIISLLTIINFLILKSRISRFSDDKTNDVIGLNYFIQAHYRTNGNSDTHFR